MVKWLVGHMATTSVWTRFSMAQRWQTIIGHLPDSVHVVVSESPVNQFADWQTLVVPNAERNNSFNLSAMRNEIRRHAEQNNFDAFMIVESDFIVVRWPSRMPSMWAIPNAIYDNNNSMSFQDIEDRHVALFRNPRNWEILGARPLIPVHCVIVSKSAYPNAVWDERFENVGYDDWDFNNKMHNECGPFEHTDALLVHRWHPSTGAAPCKPNMDLYESKWGKINATVL